MKGVDEEDKENVRGGAEKEKEDDDEDDEEEGYSSGTLHGSEDEDMGEDMHALLKDINMFRRKIGDDRSRFLGAVKREVLGARVNV